MSACMRTGLLLLAALCTAPTAHADGGQPGGTLRALEDSVVATAERKWSIGLEVANHGEFGLYLDSLVLVATPLAGTAAGQATRTRLSFGLASAAIGTDENQTTQLNLNATRIPTLLTFELYTHAHEVAGRPLSVTVKAGAYDPAVYFPPSHVRVAGRTVEMTRLAPAADANGIGLLLLPEEGTDPVATIDQAIQLSSQGFSVVVVTPPGTGGSQGPADFAGPASLAGALVALDTLANMPGVARTRLGVWGVGTGGTLALLLANARPEISGVIAQSATADPWATYRVLPADAQGAFLREAGRDSAAWRARSPLANLSHIKAAVLILHGEADTVSPGSAAHGLALALLARGVVVDAHFDGTAGHDLPATATRRLAMRFIRGHAGTAP